MLMICLVVDVSQCKVSGRGVQPTGLRVNDVAVFRVSTFNAGQGDLEVTVSRSQGKTVLPVNIVKVCIFGAIRLHYMLKKWTTAIGDLGICQSVCLSVMWWAVQMDQDSVWSGCSRVPQGTVY